MIFCKCLAPTNFSSIYPYASVARRSCCLSTTVISLDSSLQTHTRPTMPPVQHTSQPQRAILSSSPPSFIPRYVSLHSVRQSIHAIELVSHHSISHSEHACIQPQFSTAAPAGPKLGITKELPLALVSPLRSSRNMMEPRGDVIWGPLIAVGSSC